MQSESSPRTAVQADFDGVVEALSGGSPREQAVAAEMRRETP